MVVLNYVPLYLGREILAKSYIKMHCIGHGLYCFPIECSALGKPKYIGESLDFYEILHSISICCHRNYWGENQTKSHCIGQRLVASIS